MGQIVTQGIDAELLAAITKTDGTPATGLLFSAVQCQFLRQGDPSFTTKTLTSMNFVEKGQGFYGITFIGTSELNVPGAFAFAIFGAGLQTSQNEAQIRTPASLIPTVPVALPTCELTGNISDAAGNPVVGASVEARVLGQPTIETNVALTDDSVTVQTDDNGVFYLTLVRLSVVEIFINRINYRRQLTVPNLANVNIFTGIP